MWPSERAKHIWDKLQFLLREDFKEFYFLLFVFTLFFYFLLLILLFCFTIFFFLHFYFLLFTVYFLLFTFLFKILVFTILFLLFSFTFFGHLTKSKLNTKTTMHFNIFESINKIFSFQHYHQASIS